LTRFLLNAKPRESTVGAPVIVQIAANGEDSYAVGKDGPRAI
jgi:hypothetical protein